MRTAPRASLSGIPRPGASILTTGISVVASAALLVGAGCGGDDPVLETVNISIHGPDDSPSQDTIGFPKDVDPCVDTLRITSYDGLRVADQVVARWNESGIRLPTLKFGSEAWISVEGISSGASGCPPEGRTVASGATPRFTYEPDALGSLDLDIFTTVAKAFGRAFWYNDDTETSEELLYELPGQERAGHTISALTDGSGYLVIGGAKMGLPGIENSGITGVVDTIEFYDAFTGQFLAVYDDSCTTGDASCALRLPEGVAFHTATTMDDGRVLIVGGLGVLAGGTGLLPSSRAYVLEMTGYAAGYLEEVPYASGVTSVGRAFHTATKMSDGRVVIIGGIGSSYGSPTYHASVHQVAPGDVLEITDAGVSLSAARAMHSATYFDRNGHGIVVFGGRGASGVVAQSEVIFADSSDFSQPLLPEVWNAGNTEQALRTARFGHSAVRFSCPGNPVEYLAVVGGFTEAGAHPLAGSAPTDMVEFYDPDARFDETPLYAFSAATATLPGGGRAFGSGVSLPLTGDVLYMGGIDASGAVSAKADRLQNDWDPCGELAAPQAVPGGMGRARAHAAAVMLSSGFAFITGGQGATGSLEHSEFYNPDDYALVGLAP